MASWKRVITTSDDSNYKNSNIQEASTSARGGIKLFSDTDQSVAANSVSTTASRTYGIQLDSNGKAVVNVPWSDTTVANSFRTVKSTNSGGTTSTLGATEVLELEAGTNVELVESGGVVTISATDTNTQLSTADVRGKISGTGVISYDSSTGVISSSANNYSLPAATATVRGGIELGSNTQQSVAANSVSATASRTYAIQTNSDGQAVVNVPWTDSNTNTFRTIKFDTNGDGTANSTLGTTSNLELYGSGGVSLAHSGSDVTISLDSTVVKTSGTQTIAGNKSFSNNVVISGNLTVSGTSTTVNTETVTVNDNIIVLNNNAASTPTEDAGVEVERGSRTNVFINWDESAKEWTGRVQASHDNDTTGYTGRMALIERASTGSSGSIDTAGAMFINTDNGNFYVYS